MTTVQCPKCELRFWNRSEMVWHLRQDHRRTWGLEFPDRLRAPAHRRHRQGVPAR